MDWGADTPIPAIRTRRHSLSDILAPTALVSALRSLTPPLTLFSYLGRDFAFSRLVTFSGCRSSATFLMPTFCLLPHGLRTTYPSVGTVVRGWHRRHYTIRTTFTYRLALPIRAIRLTSTMRTSRRPGGGRALRPVTAARWCRISSFWVALTLLSLPNDDTLSCRHFFRQAPDAPRADRRTTRAGHHTYLFAHHVEGSSCHSFTRRSHRLSCIFVTFPYFHENLSPFPLRWFTVHVVT